MSNFVDIKTSASDIISVANNLRGQGEALDEKVKTLVEAVAVHEKEGKTFPPGDEFVETFLENYSKPGEGGKHGPPNQAVQDAAKGMGPAMTGLADYVADAMWSYQGQDEDSGKEIGSTQTSTGTSWSATRA